MPPINARLGAVRARAILELHADFAVPPEELAKQTGLGLESIRAILRGQSYRRVSRGFPIAARDVALTPDRLQAILERRLELITAHRRFGESRAVRRARRSRR
jgi:hypothetical protein